MSWGNKLVVVFILFATLIFTMVYKAMHTKYELVSKDYYKDELRYQEKIDGVINSNKLSMISILENDQQLIIDFPKEMKEQMNEGELWFYCSSDETKDRKIRLQADDSGRQVIQKNRMAKGNFQLKIYWKSGGKNYYHEQKLTIH